MRLKSLDAARGLLMLYITVVIHGAFWLRIMPAGIGATLLFEMPMVFIISGMAYGMSERQGAHRDIETAAGYRRFVLARLGRILVPYWAYASACGLLVFVWARHQASTDTTQHWPALMWAWLNPLNHGKDHDVGMLAWHLWFVPTFMLVTMLMPLAARCPALPRSRLLPAAVLVFMATWAWEPLQFAGAPLLKSTLFYLVFAVLGLQVARHPDVYRSVPWAGVAVACLLVLLALRLLSADPNVLLMQGNKFPPNHVFFVFVSLWVAVFMTLAFRVPQVQAWLTRCHDAFWLRPFIKAGYSIYLWQGLAYSLTVTAEKYTHLPPLGNLLLALVLSVSLGRVASPIERWRLRSLTD